MAQNQTLDQTNNGDSQTQPTSKDSQISSLSQLSTSDNSSATRTSWSNGPEPTSGQLNLQSMFSANNLMSELGLGNQSGSPEASQANPGASLTNLGQEFTQIGAAYTAIGTELNNLSTDLSKLQTDISGLVSALGGLENPGLTNGSGAPTTAGTDAGNYGAPTAAGTDTPANNTPTAAGTDIPTNNTPTTAGTDTPANNTPTTAGTDIPTNNTPTTAGTDTPANNTPTTAGTDIPTNNTPTTAGTDTPANNTPTTAGTDTPANNTPTTAGTDTPNGATTPTGTDTSGGTTPRTPGTPFASDSIFNMPLGSGAQWEQNSQLENAGVFINTNGNYNEPIYTGTSNDPLVTVTSDGAAGGGAGTFQVHIPAGAIPAAGGDQTFTVNDTAQNTWFSFGGFNWTGPDTATVSQGSAEPFNGSGMTQDNSNWDEGVGTLTGADLQAGTIDHMLRMELPTTMLESYTNSTDQLAPFAYPQTQEDGFAVNGNGGPAYSGTVPYGVTIGIPQGVAEPADVAANPGANMLWQALQDHGAMVRDSGGTGNNVIFQTDQNVQDSNPMVQQMEQYGNEIMQYTQILTNQGPDSINGGGTPVVPLDAPPSGA